MGAGAASLALHLGQHLEATGDQRFFLAQAQTRRTKLREDVARQLATIDTPAFKVEPKDHLYLPPDQRVRIW